MALRIKDWHRFQHFKDRRPPWVKLYRDLLDDMDWHELDAVAAKALVMLWLIASEDDGALPDTRKLAFRLRMTEDDCNTLIHNLSHWVERADDDTISGRYQSDAPETEGETETETETERTPGRKKSKRDLLLTEWIKSLPEGEAAIPADGAVFEYAAKIGLPPEYVALAWSWFKSEMAERKTRQANWRGHFFNAVKGNWPKYWFADDAGGWGLTTKGKQAQRAAQ